LMNWLATGGLTTSAA